MHIPPFISKALSDVPMPTTPAQARENVSKLSTVTRRAMIGGSMAAIPAAALAAGSTASAAATPTMAQVILTPSNHKYFQEIQVNEGTHYNIIIAAIKSLGGTPRPLPTFQGLVTSDPVTLLKMSAMFENTGAAAYFGGSPYIENPNVAAVATSIALTEAYQAGYLNNLMNVSLLPGDLPYAVPETPAQIVPLVSPFIVSLNDNGEFPPTYGTTKSVANDIAILNFALLLEYLEATFYYSSVEKTFA